MDADDALRIQSSCGPRVTVAFALGWQMAEVYRREKLFDAALDACEQALSLNPNSPEALLALVRTYHDQGDRRMTSEIGNRLMAFWAHADPDYQNRIELMKLLGVTS